MPVKSEAQRRFMYATEAGQTDAPPSVGREFINASHGLRGLPARVGKPVGKRKKKAHPSDVRRRIGKPKPGADGESYDDVRGPMRRPGY